MSRGVNKVIVLGHLGKDPEARSMPNGTAVATLSVATSEEWTDKSSGEKQKRTEWHRVVFFGRLAEIAGEYLTKGAQVYVEGSLRTRKWTDKQGVERYSTEIVGQEMQMLGGGSGNAGKGGGDGQRQQPRTDNRASANQPTGGQTGQRDEFDDDIPF